VVSRAADTALTWGFITGANYVLKAIHDVLLEPQLSHAATALVVGVGIYLLPQIVLKSISLIVIGGVVAGTATAVPIFVVGNGVVFVSFTVYNTYAKLKKKALGLPPSESSSKQNQ
jgi:hypothetical protein